MHTPLNILLLLLTSCWLSAQVSKGDILVTPRGQLTRVQELCPNARQR